MTRRVLGPILLGMLFSFVPMPGHGRAAPSLGGSFLESSWRQPHLERAADPEDGQHGKKRFVLSDEFGKWARAAFSLRTLHIARILDPRARIPEPRVIVCNPRYQIDISPCKPPVAFNASPRSPPFQA